MERLHLSEMGQHFTEIMHCTPPQGAVAITAHYAPNYSWNNISQLEN